ncbi:MAG: hypothetical protein HUJ25_01365 [Crocinitomicaceae bacterium]|nr:hypothetical protein [Crocinitomicaceae bacterium]
MKRILLILSLVVATGISAQNHSEKPIRFIFESIHDHLGNLEMNSKRVQLFSPDHRLLYEADLYDGKELDEQFFYYDEEGRLLRDHRIFHQPHESGDFRMKYDDRGNLIEEVNVDDLDRVLERKTMTYDNQGNMITKKVEFLHKEQGQMIPESYFEYTYADGKIASKEGWENEKEDETVKYAYEHGDNQETVSKYNSSGKITEQWVQKWDDKGRLIQDVHTTYESGSPISKTIDFMYDEFGHIVTETMHKSNSKLQKQIIFEYTYDEYGNWIERKEQKIMGAKHSQGVHLIRHIEYYEHSEYEHPPMELDESFVWKKEDGEDVKVFQETHVRINNNDGQLEWVVRRNGPTLYQVDEYEYKDGKLDRINHLSNSEKENAYTLAKYNDKGEQIEITSYSFDGHVDERETFEYDSKGRLIKKEEYGIDPTHGGLQAVFTEEYKYNGENQITEVDLTEYGSEYVVTYEYDASGNVIKVVLNPQEKGEESLTTTYTYKNGKLVESADFEGKSKESHDKTTYEYDDRGELIRSARYKDGVLYSEVDYVYFE